MKAFELQNQRISDASHELKTPLSIIFANTEVLYANREKTIESQIKWLDNTKVVIDKVTGFTVWTLHD